MIARVIIWGAEMDYVEARLLLGAHARGGPPHLLDRAAKLAARLRKGKTRYSRVWGLSIAAIVARRRRDDAATIAALEDLGFSAAEGCLHMLSALASHHLARMRGVPAEEPTALTAYASEQSVDAAALDRIFMPGMD